MLASVHSSIKTAVNFVSPGNGDVEADGNNPEWKTVIAHLKDGYVAWIEMSSVAFHAGISSI